MFVLVTPKSLPFMEGFLFERRTNKNLTQTVKLNRYIQLWGLIHQAQPARTKQVHRREPTVNKAFSRL
jgi:hypothetical protein